MSPQGGGSPTDDGADDLQEPLLNESIDESTDGAISGNGSNADADIDSNTNAMIDDSKNVVLKKRCCKRGGGGGENDVLLRMNHNVFLDLLLAALYGISNSLWNGTAYVAYVKKIAKGSNGPVGDIEAVSGLASLLCSLPIGYLADTMGRSVVIRFGGIVLFATALLQIGILEWAGNDVGDDDDVDHGYDENYDENNGDSAWFDAEGSGSKRIVTLWLMGATMVFWGVGDGVVNGPCQALFADSIPDGQRSTYFTYQFACYLSASAIGPLVSIALFQTLGDEWDVAHLKLIIYAGLGVEVFNSWLMMLFDDSKALDTGVDESDDENEGGDENENERDSDSETGSTSSLPSDASRATNLRKRQEWIPYIVFFSGLIISLGSGMTVKFFPLFFKDEVGMSPSQVQIIYFFVPLVMVAMGSLATKLAYAGLGRVQTTALFYAAGISLLLSMVVFKNYLDAHPLVLVPIYVLRTSLMNAIYPLQESILMDFVPKRTRARWKSLDSVAQFGWCGSAALGGWLADKYDYTRTFLLTAVFQIVALGLWCCLLPLVPRVEGASHNGGGDDGGNGGGDRVHSSEGAGGVFDVAEENAASELSEPLL